MGKPKERCAECQRKLTKSAVKFCTRCGAMRGSGISKSVLFEPDPAVREALLMKVAKPGNGVRY